MFSVFDQLSAIAGSTGKRTPSKRPRGVTTAEKYAALCAANKEQIVKYLGLHGDTHLSVLVNLLDGSSLHCVRRALSELVEERKVKRVHHGVYGLDRSGRGQTNA